MHPIVKNAYMSWKTSAVGISIAIAFVKSHPEILEDITAHKWKALFALGIALLGLLSRDGDVSSEQSGANPPPDE